MNYRNVILPIVVCLFISSCNLKKGNKDEPIAETKTTYLLSVKDVENSVENFNKALINPQNNVMNKLCAEELSYGHSSGLIQNRSEFIDDLINGTFNFLTIDTPEQTIHILEDTAIVRHTFLAQATNNGESVEVMIGNILVFHMNDNGEILLLARQAYKK